MSQESEISKRLQRLREHLASGAIAPEGYEAELATRLAEVERFAASGNEAVPMAETVWTLFQLDRCEELLDYATRSNVVAARPALDDVLQPRLGEVLFRRLMAGMLVVRGFWKREPVACYAPTLREFFYLRLPASLAWFCLPRCRQVEMPHSKSVESLPVREPAPSMAAGSRPHYSRPERMETTV